MREKEKEKEVIMVSTPQLGLLLTCEWLLSLRFSLWEKHSLQQNITRQLCAGYSQETEFLSHLVSLLPVAFPRVRG